MPQRRAFRCLNGVLNPTPIEIKPRILTTAIDLDDSTASFPLALSVAKEYGLTQERAKKLAKEVGNAVMNWREEARYYQISSAESERMASAFEHDDLTQALSF